MKKTIAILAACAAALAITANLRADDPVTVTLPVPVTVTTTTTTQTQTTAPVIEQIIIDLQAEEVGVKLRGIESRVVVSGEAYQQVMAPNLGTLVAAVQAALTAALTAPTPAP